MPDRPQIPSRTAAHRRQLDPGRPTGATKGLLAPDDSGYGGGNEWMRDAAKASAELARRVLKLMGPNGHG